MPKYRVTFSETCRYEVEFDTNQKFDPNRTMMKGWPGEWFPVMDKAEPKWMDGLQEVVSRELEDFVQLTTA